MKIDNCWKYLIGRPLSLWFTVGFVALLAAGVGLALAYRASLHPDGRWEVSPIETIRNVGLVIGGALAFLFAWWRALVAGRQADAARGQVESAQSQAGIALRTLSNERYQRGAEMLGSPVLAVRLGGIYALQSLAEEHPENYHIQIMRLFCAFVRTPPCSENDPTPFFTLDPELGDLPILREDVQTIISVIGFRGTFEKDIEAENGYRLDLRGAVLAGAELNDADFAAAHFEGATLFHANLNRARLEDARLDRARLECSELSGAKCAKASFYTAQLWGCVARCADLSGADFFGANLRDADLGSAKLTGSDMRATNLLSARLSDAEVTGTKFSMKQTPADTSSYPYDGPFGHVTLSEIAGSTKFDPNNPPEFDSDGIDAVS